MFALERLTQQCAGRRSRRRWTRLAVCANEELLKKIRNAQRRPEDWRVLALSAEHALFPGRPANSRPAGGGKDANGTIRKI